MWVMGMNLDQCCGLHIWCLPFTIAYLHFMSYKDNRSVMTFTNQLHFMLYDTVYTLHLFSFTVCHLWLLYRSFTFHAICYIYRYISCFMIYTVHLFSYRPMPLMIAIYRSFTFHAIIHLLDSFSFMLFVITLLGFVNIFSLFRRKSAQFY